MAVPPTCLVILPMSFHSVARSVIAGLEACGYTVTAANEEYPASIIGKLLSKLDLPLVRRVTERAITRRFLDGKRWDLVVIVKGRGVSLQLIAGIRQHADRIVGYQFDALAYDHGLDRWAPGVDRMSTFDYRDAEARGWPVVELYSTQQPRTPTRAEPYQVSAIMRMHSNRLAYVDQVIDALQPERHFVYFFQKNMIEFVANFAKNPALYWKWRRHIHFVPLAYDAYLDVLANSDFTIDYAHPKQTGATMRCFEALAMGVKIVSNNRWILRSSYFNDDNVVIFDGEDPAGFLAAIARSTGHRPTPIQRTPEAFIRDVLGRDVLGDPPMPQCSD